MESAAGAEAGPGPPGADPKPRIRLLHHLARSGGTIISKCLGASAGVVLLSEINPRGVGLFNPLEQAHKWFDLLGPADIENLAGGQRFDFAGMIALIEERVRARGESLVIRDWSHLDFMAAPFTPAPTYRLSLAEALAPRFEVVSTASVRHPIDEWCSLRRLDAIRGRLSLDAYLRGYRRFAEAAAHIGFLRYEDFTRAPEQAMARLCARLALDYDPDFRSRQRDYRTITGARTGPGDIRPARRGAVESELIEEMGRNPAYREAIAILGYRHPA